MLFAVYVNDILEKVPTHNMVVVFDIFLLMYADDLLLESSSITDLQQLVTMCISELNKIDMKVNSKKSNCLRVGLRMNLPNNKVLC